MYLFLIKFSYGPVIIFLGNSVSEYRNQRFKFFVVTLNRYIWTNVHGSVDSSLSLYVNGIRIYIYIDN